jgi:hypothetical protein
MALPPIPSNPKSSKKGGGRVHELAVPGTAEGTYGRSASMDVNRTPGGNASAGIVRSGYSSETELGNDNVGRYGPGVGGGKPMASSGTINRLRKMSLPKPKMSMGTGNAGSGSGGGGFWQKREYVSSSSACARVKLTIDLSKYSRLSIMEALRASQVPKGTEAQHRSICRVHMTIHEEEVWMVVLVIMLTENRWMRGHGASNCRKRRLS